MPSQLVRKRIQCIYIQITPLMQKIGAAIRLDCGADTDNRQQLGGTAGGDLHKAFALKIDRQSIKVMKTPVQQVRLAIKD